PTKGPAAAIVKFAVQMHADITFLKRELPAAESAADSLERFSQAFAEVSPRVAVMARGRASAPDTQPLRDACRQAAERLQQQCPDSDGARLMLRRLVEDLIALIRSIERAGVARQGARISPQT